MTEQILGVHPESDGLLDVQTEAGAVARANGLPPVVCHECLGGEGQATCAQCAGRGFFDDIPYLPDPWTEVIPNLFVGGHRVDSWENQKCIVTDEFDLVVSLHSEPGYGPQDGIPEVRMRIRDADLDPEHHDKIDVIANEVAARVRAGEKVLVRCLAGINRSSLVAARAMMINGLTADEAITKIRLERSPFCLFNQSFVAFLRSQDV